MTVTTHVSAVLDRGFPDKYRGVELVAMFLFAIYFTLTSESRVFQLLGIATATLAAFGLGLLLVIGQTQPES